MSNTPKQTDDCMKLLDSGHIIVLFKNELGSYSARAVPENHSSCHIILQAVGDGSFKDRYFTDDFTPSQVLYRLTEKVYGNIA